VDGEIYWKKKTENYTESRQTLTADAFDDPPHSGHRGSLPATHHLRCISSSDGGRRIGDLNSSGNFAAIGM